MKPILILELREEDSVADSEYHAFLEYGGLKETDTHRVRMEKDDIHDLDLNNYSAVIVGGGPWCVSDADDKKSQKQKEAEEFLRSFLADIIDRDFPYLGACYGFGVLAQFFGGCVSKDRYSEDIGGIDVVLSDEAENDPIMKGLPHTFRTLGGHKESCQTLPECAVTLAYSKDCPYHMFRVKENVYATQFHPELDAEGICLRIDIYKNAGYFPPEDAGKLIDETKDEKITVPMEILKRFVDRYYKK